MGLFHKHVWKEVERFYALPQPRTVIKGYGIESLVQKFLLGVTTILYKCEVCNKQKFVEILGKFERRCDD